MRERLEILEVKEGRQGKCDRVYFNVNQVECLRYTAICGNRKQPIKITHLWFVLTSFMFCTQGVFEMIVKALCPLGLIPKCSRNKHVNQQPNTQPCLQ